MRPILNFVRSKDRIYTAETVRPSAPNRLEWRSKLNTQCERFGVNQGDRIFACSDGLLEARSKGGELFGAARLEACFEGIGAPHLFKAVEEAVTAHRDGQAQEDDLAFVEAADNLACRISVFCR